MEERLRNKKEWTIEDAIMYLQIEVDVLDAEIKIMKPEWNALRDKRNSLRVGLKNLQELQKRELQRREAEG